MNRRILKITGTVVIIVVTFLGGWYANIFWDRRKQDQARNVAAEYIQLIMAGKTDEAYKMTTKELQKNTNINQFKELYKGSQLNGVKYAYTAVSKIEGKYVVYSFLNNLPKDSTGSTNGTFIVGLAKDDGKLKVESGILQ